jgi:BirA family biotin operon repressor/biotin-[acetyl-CoA-carboxylase] ligase
VGIGINVDVTPLATATSLKEEGIIISKKFLLKKIFEKIKEFTDKKNLLGEYKKILETLGKTVTIRTINENYEGVAIDIDEIGRLLIRRNNRIETITAGDCLHLS